MDAVADLYLAHPAWTWFGAAALFLAVEVATGTTYLLWPAASAAAVAVLFVLGLAPMRGVDAGVFALLTIVTTLLARRYIRRPAVEENINDPRDRLLGRRGSVAHRFDHGEGRVFVDGKEWPAELEGEGDLAKGAPVVVAGVLDSGRLRVRAD